MAYVYALFGAPAKHSLSPWLHQQFAAQCGLQIEYRVFEVAADELMIAIQDFVRLGGQGANVTAPYKQIVYQQLQNVTTSAEHAVAVNTIAVTASGQLQGDNTDGIGFLRDLQRKQISVNGKNILIIGNGGAARAIKAALQTQNPANIMVITRNNCLVNQEFDLIINATSAGLRGELPQLPDNLIWQNTVCYDLNYGAAALPFLEHAQIKGAKWAINGWGMLVEQAAESFYIWNKYRPTTDQISEVRIL